MSKKCSTAPSLPSIGFLIQPVLSLLVGFACLWRRRCGKHTAFLPCPFLNLLVALGNSAILAFSSRSCTAFALLSDIAKWLGLPFSLCHYTTHKRFDTFTPLSFIAPRSLLIVFFNSLSDEFAKVRNISCPIGGRKENSLVVVVISAY